MLKPGLLFLLAVPYIDNCDSPTDLNCARALAAIQGQERECDRLEPDERQAEPRCGQVGKWRSLYEQKCGIPATGAP